MTEESPEYETRVGRPPKSDDAKKHAKGIRVAYDVFRFLLTRPRQNEFIESAIRKTPEFRDWKKSQG